MLQEKFDKHMKVSNNLNQDLKEEIEEQNVKIGKLQIFYDDQVEIMAAEKAKVDKLIYVNNSAKDEEVKLMKEEKDKYKQELEQFKSEF